MAFATVHGACDKVTVMHSPGHCVLPDDELTNPVDNRWIMLVGDCTFLTIQPGQPIMQEPAAVVTDWTHMLCKVLEVKAVTQKSIENSNGVPSVYQSPEHGSTISVPWAVAIPWDWVMYLWEKDRTPIDWYKIHRPGNSTMARCSIQGNAYGVPAMGLSPCKSGTLGSR